MREFQQRKMFRSLMYSKLAIFLLLVVFLFFIFSIIGVYGKNRKATGKNNEVESELNELRKKKDYFESEIDRLNTNAGAEEELRDKFQIAKPGERVLIIVDDDKDGKGESSQEKSPNWFWRIFGR